MKKIAIIGASGFIGSAILKEALDRNYKVTALVRHPEKIALRDNLVVLPVDAMNAKELEDALRGFDTVISAYNPGWENPDISADTTAGYRSIIEASKKAGVKRLLIVGGAGSLYISTGYMLMESGQIPDYLLPAIKALADIYHGTSQGKRTRLGILLPGGDHIPWSTYGKIPPRT